MRKARFLFLTISSSLIVACSTPHRGAPVVERPVEGSKAVEVAKGTGAPKQADARGYYTVRKGDTLFQIALDFGQNYRDLVEWNNLSNPDDIKVDQVLRVLPPEGGAQTASISTSSGVEVRPLGSAPASAGPATSNKSGPRGDKRPYSDAALAELQKPDTAPASTSASTPQPAATAKAEPAKPVQEKPASSPPPALAPGDENITWVWPADGKVISAFSESKRGIDIAGKMGQPVVAASGGKVLYAGSGIRGYGNLVIVKHSSNLLSAYAHNKTIFVKEDQIVSKGQKIAEMGNSDTDEVKLHFEIRHQGKPVDPIKYLPSRQ